MVQQNHKVVQGPHIELWYSVTKLRMHNITGPPTKRPNITQLTIAHTQQFQVDQAEKCVKTLYSSAQVNTSFSVPKSTPYYTTPYYITSHSHEHKVLYLPVTSAGLKAPKKSCTSKHSDILIGFPKPWQTYDGFLDSQHRTKPHLCNTQLYKMTTASGTI